ncbi:MAG TPA: hypothetical protein VF898_12085, partial [Chloroflexota bacterium]
SPLQRFDRLEPMFNRTGSLSSDLAVDLRQVNRALAAEWLPSIRSQAAVTMRHARELEQSTGAAQWAVQRLRRATLPAHVGTYFYLEGRALTAEWWEGFHVIALSRLLQKDPLATIAGDATLVKRLSSGAIRSANMARYWANRGKHWKTHYRRALRYVPIGTPTAT